MIVVLQLFSLSFALLMIYLALLNRKRKEISASEFLSWFSIWTVVILITLVPDIFRTFAQEVLLTRLFDLVMLGGIAVSITLAAMAYVRSKKLEKKLEKLIRDSAIKKTRKK